MNFKSIQHRYKTWKGEKIDFIVPPVLRFLYLSAKLCSLCQKQQVIAQYDFILKLGYYGENCLAKITKAPLKIGGKNPERLCE